MFKLCVLVVAFSVIAAVYGDNSHGHGMCNSKNYTFYDSRSACKKQCTRPCVGSIIECAVFDPASSNVVPPSSLSSANATRSWIMGKCLDPESTIVMVDGVQTNTDEYHGFDFLDVNGVSNSGDPCTDLKFAPEISDIKLQLDMHGQFCGISTSNWNASLNVQGTIFGFKIFDNSFLISNGMTEFHQSPNLGIVKADYSFGGFKMGNEIQLKFWGEGCYWTSFVWHCKEFDWVLLKWTP